MTKLSICIVLLTVILISFTESKSSMYCEYVLYLTTWYQGDSSHIRKMLYFLLCATNKDWQKCNEANGTFWTEARGFNQYRRVWPWPVSCWHYEGLGFYQNIKSSICTLCQYGVTTLTEGIFWTLTHHGHYYW